jgi:hypothetical protein
VLQRHEYNLSIAATGTTPQQLLGKRIAADTFAPVLFFASTFRASGLAKQTPVVASGTP